MSAALLADIVLAVHVGFVAFVVGGFALILVGLVRGWGWVGNPVFRWAHLGAIAVVALEALAGVACPLTVWEDILRRGAASETSFMARALRRLLYWDFPPWAFTALYVSFAAAVSYVMWRHPPRRRRGRNSLSSVAESRGPEAPRTPP